MRKSQVTEQQTQKDHTHLRQNVIHGLCGIVTASMLTQHTQQLERLDLSKMHV